MQDKIVSYARECLGTPFRHQARIIHVGMDCAGLAIHVMQKLGLDYVDIQAYPRHPYKGMMEHVLSQQPCLKQIAQSDLDTGDILLMRFRKEPQHVAIYTGDNRIIHSYSGSGKVVEHGLDGVWKRGIVAAYRITP